MTGWNLWMAGGWLIAAAGLCLVLLFVFGRRVLLRRTPRCVACAYRLDGIPAADGAVRCPECGRAARGVAEPYALGRRGWIGLLGVLLLTAGLALPSIPVVRAQGWSAVLPVGIQARIMPHSDDERLWTRVAEAADDGGLSPSAADRFRADVLARMVDRNADATPALRAFVLVMRSRIPELIPFDRADLWRIVANGSPTAKRQAHSHVNGRPPPQGDEITLRREAWHGASGYERGELLEWIAMHPAGDEDLAIIRQAFENDPWRAASSVGGVLKDALPDTHRLMLDLIQHPQPEVRRGVVMALEDWMRERDVKPPLEIQNAIFLAATEDPDFGVVDFADRSLENLSEEFGPRLGVAVAATMHAGRFENLLRSATRKDDPGVLPGLEEAARQPQRPLWQRAKAARAHAWIRARTRQASEKPDFLGVYSSVVDGLLRGDAELLLRIGQDEYFGWDEQMLLAILQRAEVDGVRPEALDSWLASSPGLAGVLMLAEPAAGSPIDALSELIRQDLRGRSPDDRLLAAMTHWFPEHFPQEEAD